MMDNTGIEKYIGREFDDGSWRKCFDSGEKWLERKKNQPPLTVVIPVYNGLEFLSRLLGALEQAPGIDSIILVDDHSPDPQTAALCAEWAQNALNRMCIRNSRNLGFVRSVNIGIMAAPEKNDIILLNSDTVPSRQFAQRLKNAACSLPNVATVTPLSNAAGIFSVPIPKENNSLPAGWTVDQFATLLELVSGAPYEVIPAGSGFCLYITRNAIDNVGVFDELLFERGYAEESDFCRRAAKKGFVNLVDMSTFVYHEREVSFGSEKVKLKKQNSNFLKMIEPDFISDSLKWENSSRLIFLSKTFNNLNIEKLNENTDIHKHNAYKSLKVTKKRINNIDLNPLIHDIIISNFQQEIHIYFANFDKYISVNDYNCDDIITYISFKHNTEQFHHDQKSTDNPS